MDIGFEEKKANLTPSFPEGASIVMIASPQLDTTLDDVGSVIFLRATVATPIKLIITTAAATVEADVPVVSVSLTADIMGKNSHKMNIDRNNSLLICGEFFLGVRILLEVEVISALTSPAFLAVSA